MSELVYLAGPIAYTIHGGAFEWRNHATTRLYSYGLKALNPLRAKDSLRGERIPGDFHKFESRGVFFTTAGIMTRDYTDVQRANALLVNLLGADKVSLGTVMEMAWAWAMQKPCVVAIEESGNPHDNHPMLHEVIRKFRVATLDEAIHCTAVILGR